MAFNATTDEEVIVYDFCLDNSYANDRHSIRFELVYA